MHKDSLFESEKLAYKESPQALIEIIRRFRHLRILVIGDAMLDTYLEGTASRLCREGPVPVVLKTAEHHLAGGAANTAMNLRALGATVDLLGIIGEDEVGSRLRTVLRQQQIDDQWLIADAGRQTQHKLRILANRQYVVRLDEGEAANQTNEGHSEAARTLLMKLEMLYAQCDAIIISDYCYGTVKEEVIDLLRTLHTQCPKPILIDSKDLWRFRQLPSTVITPNAWEAQSLLDKIELQKSHALHSKAQIASLAQLLLQTFSTQHVVMTLGADGAFLTDAERLPQGLHIPARRVQQANDVGAGDSFAATLILTLAAGAPIEDAIQMAIDSAGIAVTKTYTATVSQQELLQRVSLRISTENSRRGSSFVHSLEYVMDRIEREKLSGRKVVLTNGVFDILHLGHINLLRQARQLGDILVVAINSDQCTRKLKGPGRPINNQDDRLALVAALDMVDYALLFEEDTPERLIRLIRPDIHVKGGDYIDKVLPEEKAIQEVGGQLIILPFTPPFSTSRVIERIVALTSQESS